MATGVYRWALCTSSIVGIVLLSGCTSDPVLPPSSESDTTAFCDLMTAHQSFLIDQRSLGEWNGANGMPASLNRTTSVSALQEMWESLLSTAPTEIKPDVESIAETWRRHSDATTNRDDITLQLVGMVEQGTITRVEEYANANCDDSWISTGGPERIVSRSAPTL